MASLSNKFFAFLMLSFLASSVHGQLLTANFYDKTCPNLVAIVRDQMGKAIAKESRMAASILRLMFHDCFVDGCNAGPLLNTDPFGNSEQTASPNKNSLLGFNVIDDIKTELEKQCGTKIVSCADILVLAAREGVNLVKGPTWKVLLGRKDTKTANPNGAELFLPGPGSSLTQLVALFKTRGFSPEEMTALSGAHTIGKSQCRFFTSRTQNDANIDSTFASDLNTACSADKPVPQPIDKQTPEIFDNAFYKNLLTQEGLFHSDQELYNSTNAAPTDAGFLILTKDKVIKYSEDGDLFATEFGLAMEKLGNIIDPLSILFGDIRSDCKKVN